MADSFPMSHSVPKLVLAASLWTLDGHKWSLDRKLATIKDAGFEAVIGTAPPQGLRPLLKKYQLRFSAVFTADSKRVFAEHLAHHRREGAEHATVQIRPPTLSTSKALQLTCALLKEAKRQGMTLAIETHRATITESPEGLFALADAYHEKTGLILPLAWDPSHLAVVRHLKPFEFSDRLLARPELVAASWIMHCRPFNGQHAQVPICDHDGKLTREGREWLRFAKDQLTCWLDAPHRPSELWVCPEIGPEGIHGYNLSTMPSSWLQALVCRSELLNVWKKTLRLTKKSSTSDSRAPIPSFS